MTKTKFINWLLVIIWASLIFILSAQPSLPRAGKFVPDYFFKKLAHISVYLILYILLMRALGKNSPKYFISAFILCVLYAVSDEIHQSLVPGRTPHILDIGFDSLGISIAHLRLRGWI